MRIPRIYHPESIKQQTQIILSEEAANHVGRVLRMQTGQQIQLFDGTNYQFQAELTTISKKQIIARIIESEQIDRESPLHLHLGQVISRGDKMEFTIQKSVELGVSEITPLYSERCGVKLDAERAAKKQQQWQKIAISACEQCGRNVIPIVHPITQLEDWCKQQDAEIKLNLHPRASLTIQQLTLADKPTVVQTVKPRINLLIGSEGGLSEEEIEMTLQHGFTEILLGPRVLRTETAALTAITALQFKFGDLG